MSAKSTNTVFAVVIGGFSVLAYGCLAGLALLFALHIGRLVTGTTPPPRIMGALLALSTLAGAITGVVMTRRRFRSKSLPPWLAPRRLSRNAADNTARTALMQRLDAVPPGEATYRDRETGQLWAEVYWHDGYEDGFDLVPLKSLTTVPHQSVKGGQPPPWASPRPLSWLGAGGDLQARLLARCDMIAEARPQMYEGPTYRDRYTQQVWRSVASDHGFGTGYNLVPVLADDKSPPPPQQRHDA